MGKKRLLLICAVLLSLASPAIAQAPAAKRVLRVRALSDPHTLDWNRANTWMDGLLIYNLMEGLVTIDSNLKPVPALAEKWTISPDLKTYTFQIRKNAKWSDGVGLKAQDFIASWKRLLTPQTEARYASFLYEIENAEAFHKGQLTDFSKVGVRATNDYTLVVKLRAPNASWYWATTPYISFPIREDLVQKNPENWYKAGTMVSIGPYTLKSHEVGRTIVLEKNPHYYGKTGNVDEVHFALVQEDSLAFNLFEQGQIDVLPKAPAQEKNRVQGKTEFYPWHDLRTVYLKFNSKQGLASDAALRRAIALSIDRAKLKQVFNGDYQRAASFVPPGLVGYSEKVGLHFDPKKAKQDLKAAGFDLSTLPGLDLLTINFNDHVKLAEFIRDELKSNLGLEVKVHVFEPKRYYSPLVNRDDYNMELKLWSADFPDADNMLSIFLGSAAIYPNTAENKNYDQLILSARHTSDAAKRTELYRKAQKILIEQDVLNVPMYYDQSYALVRKGLVKSFDAKPFRALSLKQINLK